MRLIRFHQNRYLGILLLLLTSFLLVHAPCCAVQKQLPANSASENVGHGRTSSDVNRPIVIGYSGCAPSTDFWNKLSQSMMAQASLLSLILVDFSSEDFSIERQKKNVTQAIDLAVDGMILGAVSDGLEDSVELLKKNKIPVVTVGVPINHGWVTTHVGTDSLEAARLAGAYIETHASKINPSGKRIVIVSGDKDQENSRIRGNTPATILRSAGYDVSVRFSEDWSGVNALHNFLEEFAHKPKDIGAVFSTFEPGSVAMVEAAESSNINALLVGFDWSDTMRQMIIVGRLHAAVVQNPVLIGKEGLLAMVSELKDQSPPEHINVPPLLITIDNVELH